MAVIRFLRLPRPLDLRAVAQAASVRSSGSMRTPLDVEVLVWAGGDLEQAREPLLETLERVQEELPDALLTVLLDGPEWEAALRPWLARRSRRREVVLPRATDLPHVLYQAGLSTSVHPWTALLWAGCDLSGAGLRRLRAAAGEAGLVHGDLAQAPPAEYAPPVQHAWLQMADLVPMHNALLSSAAARGLAWDSTPLLQRTFWWDLTLRLSARVPFAHESVPSPARRWDWSSYPLRPPDAVEPELAMRFTARPDRDVSALARDLPAADRQRLTSGLRHWHDRHGLTVPSPPAIAEPPTLGPGRWPLKVTVLSGLHDGHQNRLFFYGYFERMAGRGQLTWRTVLYDRCRPEDLTGIDLAVFSRPRFAQVPALLDACAKANVPVLVMIDDNWIAGGREHRRFARLFTSGQPPFEVFLEALRRAQAVLVFNSLLEEDVRPLARRVLLIPPNVDFSLFGAPPVRRLPGFLAGFAGSPRWSPAGFLGLAAFLRRHRDAGLLVMAHEVPEELRTVEDARVTFVPWQHHYAAYARTLAGLRPDVLIAPLDASRFSASKVPNKFLEAAAAGAAGVYSRLPPYTEHVRDGETGLLVDNDPRAWQEALERLHGNPALRARIAQEAAREVRERFSTEQVLPRFEAALQSVVRGRTP